MSWGFVNVSGRWDARFNHFISCSVIVHDTPVMLHDINTESMFNFFFCRTQVPSHPCHWPIGAQKCLVQAYKQTETKERMVSVLLRVILQWRKCLWSYGNNTPAFMMWDYHDTVKKGQIKTILPQFSLTVCTTLFVQHR